MNIEVKDEDFEFVLRKAEEQLKIVQALVQENNATTNR